MHYMGSKRLIAKHIMPIILANRKPGQWYIEPFIGGANSFLLAENPRLGLDINPAAIQAHILIRDDPLSLPTKADDISPELYQIIKKDVNHPWHGYVGFACSFGGKYFGGRIKAEYLGDKENYQMDRVTSQYETAQKDSVQLQGSILGVLNYQDLKLPKESIVYCDPPYAGTTNYKNSNFDSKGFWQWCRERVAEGHKVFVSEYGAPDDFVVVWEKIVRSTVGISNNKQAVEKLFIHKDQL